MTLGTRAAADNQGQQLAQIKTVRICISGRQGLYKSKEVGSRARWVRMKVAQLRMNPLTVKDDDPLTQHSVVVREASLNSVAQSEPVFFSMMTRRRTCRQ